MNRSYTVWERLDPISRNPDLTSTLRMELSDPLWLLTRQWQFGEFMGEDAGSPVKANVTYRQDKMTRIKLGSAEAEHYNPDIDLKESESGTSAPANAEAADRKAETDPPLEVLIEREPVAARAEGGPPARLRAEAGMHFLRRLHDVMASALPRLPGPADFKPAYWLEQPEVADADGRRYTSVLSGGRALDGHRLYTELTKAEPEELLAEFDGWPDDPPEAYAMMLEDFKTWYENLLQEPMADQSAWDPQCMEYEAYVSTGAGDRETVFQVSEYKGGRLDWYDFDVSTSIESLNPETEPASSQTIVRQPTRASFRGMAAPRLWEMEDASINLSAVTAAGDDLSRLFLLEFMLISGNDWFTFPLEAPIGSLTQIDSIKVLDTFDIPSTVGENERSDWQMYTFDDRLLLPPVVGSTLHSEPVERVTFGRDQVANLLFAIEETYEGPLGEPVDREVFTLPTLVIEAAEPADAADKEYIDLRNKGDDILSLEGWGLRVDGLSKTFSDIVLSPHSSLRVVMGTDAVVEADLYLGEENPVLSDATTVEITDQRGGVVQRKPLHSLTPRELDTYHLVNEIPDHWFPYVLRPRDHGSRFVQAVMLDADALSGSPNAIPTPLGHIIRPDRTLHEQAVTRSGLSVTRQYQMAQWVDGHIHLWSSRRARPGRGDVSSTLRFDSLERPSTDEKGS